MEHEENECKSIGKKAGWIKIRTFYLRVPSNFNKSVIPKNVSKFAGFLGYLVTCEEFLLLCYGHTDPGDDI